jgi:hypothetical protein
VTSISGPPQVFWPRWFPDSPSECTNAAEYSSTHEALGYGDCLGLATAAGACSSVRHNRLSWPHLKRCCHVSRRLAACLRAVMICTSVLRRETLQTTRKSEGGVVSQAQSHKPQLGSSDISGQPETNMASNVRHRSGLLVVIRRVISSSLSTRTTQHAAVQCPLP